MVGYVPITPLNKETKSKTKHSLELVQRKYVANPMRIELTTKESSVEKTCRSFINSIILLGVDWIIDYLLFDLLFRFP